MQVAVLGLLVEQPSGLGDLGRHGGEDRGDELWGGARSPAGDLASNHSTNGPTRLATARHTPSMISITVTFGCCITALHPPSTSTVTITRSTLIRRGLTRCATPSGLIVTPAIEVSAAPTASSSTAAAPARTWYQAQRGQPFGCAGRPTVEPRRHRG